MRINSFFVFSIKYKINRMKFYETHYEDYIGAVDRYNLHPELKSTIQSFPTDINQLENLIIYGPPGVGKYSQILSILKRYSPSELKYDKRITAETEKTKYIYRISDIHYEVDMSLLGCNSKLLWHEIFFQIVDIILVKPNKVGVIVCKNFHLIHAELLEIFYSYIQQYNHSQANIKIIFFIMTEQISFIPTPIINACHILKVRRPTKESYEKLELSNQLNFTNNEIEHPFLKRITNNRNKMLQGQSTNMMPVTRIPHYNNIIKDIDLAGITNIKEIRYFQLIDPCDEMPKDVFNIICDNIIKEIVSPKTLVFTGFRDLLYDILTYNLDMTDCLWYMLTYFIENRYLKTEDISDILIKSYTFLKYYNNNYRPIYHLESIMFTIINKIHNFTENNELRKGM